MSNILWDFMAPPTVLQGVGTQSRFSTSVQRSDYCYLEYSSLTVLQHLLINFGVPFRFAYYPLPSYSQRPLSPLKSQLGKTVLNYYFVIDDQQRVSNEYNLISVPPSVTLILAFFEFGSVPCITIMPSFYLKSFVQLFLCLYHQVFFNFKLTGCYVCFVQCLNFFILAFLVFSLALCVFIGWVLGSFRSTLLAAPTMSAFTFLP